jgi:hypothetical protein
MTYTPEQFERMKKHFNITEEEVNYEEEDVLEKIPDVDLPIHVYNRWKYTGKNYAKHVTQQHAYEKKCIAKRGRKEVIADNYVKLAENHAGLFKDGDYVIEVHPGLDKLEYVDGGEIVIERFGLTGQEKKNFKDIIRASRKDLLNV